jgi:hypothetical protein
VINIGREADLSRKRNPSMTGHIYFQPFQNTKKKKKKNWKLVKVEQKKVKEAKDFLLNSI